MRNQASRAIFDYWINLKHDGAVPLKTEIDPTALRHLLPHLFMAAMDPAGTLAFRLAGTRICDLFDREFRGQAFANIWPETDHRQPVEIAHNVIHSQQPALLDVLASNGHIRHAYEMLLLPIRSAETAASDRIFGALLPRLSPYPVTATPAAFLTLENWTFLTGSGSHFGVPVTGDRGIFHNTRGRLPTDRPLP
ncbi:PAS domain-containing protein [Neorhizobium galegae]|uniref:PAS domain-containing protein n=1 Tax=Neorhizobium galegae TaxID=399 RepID=UPI002100DBB7|nr:PAS domain-containing protein [Neorhizobium galegae]MCQ1572168.1 PAS domain-containing protein [Neorhizobium galegae]